MNRPAYITASGTFLPGPPINNAQMEDRLGRIAGKPSRLKKRMLLQNGITSRHYALNAQQQTTHRNDGGFCCSQCIVVYRFANPGY